MNTAKKIVTRTGRFWKNIEAKLYPLLMPIVDFKPSGGFYKIVTGNKNNGKEPVL
jgi:hypothetical protein